MSRARDAKGRFIPTPKAKPLSAQQVGDVTALQILEEAEPAHCLELTDVFTVHESWWQAKPPDVPQDQRSALTGVPIGR
jgi:hypothetical protein